MTSMLTRPGPGPEAGEVGAAPSSAGELGRTTGLSRLRGRWRIALRYGARDARRHKGRTAMIAAMVMLPVAAGATISTVAWSQRDTPERVVAAQLGPVLQATAGFRGPGLMQSPDGSSVSWDWDGEQAAPSLPEAAAALRDVLPAGAEVSPALGAWVTVHGPALQLSTDALQADLTDPATVATWPLAEGTLPVAGEVALSRSTANQLRVSVGDEVSLRLTEGHSETTPHDLGSATVSGILEAPSVRRIGVLMPEDGPFSPPVDVGGALPSPTWLISGDTAVTWDDVVAANAAGFMAISRDVLLDPPADHLVPAFAGQPRGQATQDFLTQWGVVIALIGVALFEAVLLVGPSYAVGARRSARTLALVAANGGSPRALRAIVLGTAAVIGVGASLAGAVLGLAIAVPIVAAQPRGLGDLAIPAHLIAVMVVIGVLLSLGGALVPARGAARLDVVATLAGRRGEVAARRRTAVVGGVLVAAGYGFAAAMGATGNLLLMVGGIVVGQVGLLLAVGGIVSLLGRLAGRLSLSWRLALRDAARNRRRTSPAVAAVLVATAGATAGMVYVAADAQHTRLTQTPVASAGVFTVALDTWNLGGGLTQADVAAIEAAVADVAPQVGELIPVRVMPEVPGAAGESETGLSDVVLMRRVPPGLQGDAIHGGGGRLPGPIVDDGSLAHLLGFEDPRQVSEILAGGRIVARATSLFDDDTVRFGLERWTEESVTVDAELSFPATAVGDPRGMVNHNLPILPLTVAEELAGHGFTPVVGGLISAEPTRLSRAERETIQARIDEIVGVDEWGWSSASVGVSGQADETFADYTGLITAILFGAGAFLALAAAWITAALAATESRPDLATLTAVGARPSTRKRLIAAQAGTVVLIGAVIGSVSGLALGAAFVLDRRYTHWGVNPAWEVVVPWAGLAALVVGLPVLAVGAAWLVTRGRETLTRRLAA